MERGKGTKPSERQDNQDSWQVWGSSIWKVSWESCGRYRVKLELEYTHTSLGVSMVTTPLLPTDGMPDIHEYTHCQNSLFLKVGGTVCMAR